MRNSPIVVHGESGFLHLKNYLTQREVAFSEQRAGGREAHPRLRLPLAIFSSRQGRILGFGDDGLHTFSDIGNYLHNPGEQGWKLIASCAVHGQNGGIFQFRK